MSKALAALMLVALGLAMGLYLGFNPERRAAVQSTWNQASDSVAQLKVQVGLGQPDQQAAPAVQDQNPQPAETGVTTTTKVAVALQEFWQATRQLWFNLVARISA